MGKSGRKILLASMANVALERSTWNQTGKIANNQKQLYTGVVTKPLVILALLSLLHLVACQRATETPPPSPTAQVLVVPVVATSAPTDIPSPTALPTATATPSRVLQAPSRTRTATRAPATSTRPRPTATGVPPTPAAPPATVAPAGTLLDGKYSSTGSVRVQFTVSGGGTTATDGFFNFHCPVDGALETYGFSGSAAIVGGKFAFSALPARSGAAQVTMVCTAVTSTQARCTMRNQLATNKCLDTPANASRQ